ncbi:MAG TPA: hypothetical protein VID27_11645 [Blastocatellia bacterium]
MSNDKMKIKESDLAAIAAMSGSYPTSKISNAMINLKIMALKLAIPRLAKIACCGVLLFALTALIQPATAAGQQLDRQGDYTAGSIYNGLSTATVYQGLMVTAVRLNSTGELKLIAWEVSGNGQGDVAGGEEVVRKGSIVSPGYVSIVAIVNMGNHRVVTAARNQDGNLQLILWQISSDGLQIEKKDEYVAGGVTEISLAFLTTSQFVTAVRLTNGNLKLIVWKILDGHLIDRRGDYTAGAITKVSATSTGALGNGSGLVTAVRLKSGGLLKLISWWISNDGLTIERRDSAVAGAVSQVAIVHSGTYAETGFTNVQDVVVTAVRDSDGNLKLISWWVSEDSLQLITRKDDAVAEAVSKVAITRVGTPFHSDRLITSVRDGDGILKLTAWDVTSQGQITRQQDAYAGGISDLAANRVWSNYLVTAVRTNSGNLKLIAWKHSF